MRVLIVCAIVISTALGLAGCFHHQQAVVAQPMPHRPHQITRGLFSCDYLSYKCQGSVADHLSSLQVSSAMGGGFRIVLSPRRSARCRNRQLLMRRERIASNMASCPRLLKK